jgi:hypothetical protein
MMTVITAATSEAARAKLEDYRFYVSKKRPTGAYVRLDRQ